MSTNTAAQTTKTYKANCHCVQIKYTVAVTPPLEENHEIVSCNCSICVRHGKLNIYIPSSQVTFIEGKNKIKEYKYANLLHAFCPDCGTSLYCHFQDPKHEWYNDWAMSVRPFLDIDLSKLKIKNVDMKDVGPKYEPGW